MVQSNHPLIHPWIPLLKVHKKSLISYICYKRRRKREHEFINDLVTAYKSFLFLNVLYTALFVKN